MSMKHFWLHHLYMCKLPWSRSSTIGKPLFYSSRLSNAEKIIQNLMIGLQQIKSTNTCMEPVCNLTGQLNKLLKTTGQAFARLQRLLCMLLQLQKLTILWHTSLENWELLKAHSRADGTKAWLMEKKLAMKVVSSSHEKNRRIKVNLNGMRSYLQLFIQTRARTGFENYSHMAENRMPYTVVTLGFEPNALSWYVQES